MDFLHDEAFPAILKKDYYKFIQSRGELMIKLGKRIPWKDLLHLTDQDFCKELEISLNQLKIEGLKSGNTFVGNMRM